MGLRMLNCRSVIYRNADYKRPTTADIRNVCNSETGYFLPFLLCIYLSREVIISSEIIRTESRASWVLFTSRLWCMEALRYPHRLIPFSVKPVRRKWMIEDRLAAEVHGSSSLKYVNPLQVNTGFLDWICFHRYFHVWIGSFRFQCFIFRHQLIFFQFI